MALVPPLCVVGIGLGLGSEIAVDLGSVSTAHPEVAKGAFLLFLANLAGITFTACLVFLSQSYGTLKKAFQTLVSWFLGIALLCGPLTNSLQGFFITNRINLELHKIRQENLELFQQIQVRYVNVQLEVNTAYLTIIVLSPEGLLTDEKLQVTENRLFNSISSMGVKSMDLDIRIVPVKIREYKSITR